MNSLPQNLEIRPEAKPVWEKVIKEIVETRRELSKRLDRTEAVLRETQAGLRDVKDRLEKIEHNLPQ